ncbi:MAG: SnoaL-like domain-containing protein [Bacteroidota bacterium]
MTIQEIATRLVILSRQGQFENAQNELFSNDAISIEAHATPAFEKETKGLNAILEKGRKFESMVEEMHKMEVSEPIIANSSFACTLRMEVTMKEGGHMDMTELCVYEVKDGKIVSETFYM